MAKRLQDRYDWYDTQEFWDYVDSYAAFVTKYKKYMDYYANVDVIYDPERSWKVLKYLEKEHGLNPVPVIHYGASLKWVEKHIEAGYDLLGIGGLGQGATKNTYKVWANEVFKVICPLPSRMPVVRTHGFAMTSYDLMLSYPFWCMTEEHEVLTQSGWKGRDEIKVGELVLVYENGKSVWQPVLEIPKFPVVDTPIIEMDYRTFSARVTANHRWRVKHRNWRNRNSVNEDLDNDVWSWKTTDELNENHLIPRIGKYDCPKTEVYSDWFVELSAWYWTEGSIKNRPNYRAPAIDIYQSKSKNPRKVERIRKALLNEGEKFCEWESKGLNYTGKKRTMVVFELYGHVRDSLIEMFPNKVIPIEFILKLTEKQLKSFIKISIMGDGNLNKTLAETRKVHTPWVKEIRKKERIGGKGFAISQKYGKNLDVFRVACLLAGIPTSKQKPDKDGQVTVVSLSTRLVYPGSFDKKIVPYTGTLWCIKVESGAFFTKCNEKIYVTGNSVDSATWTKVGAFGSIIVPKTENGEFTFNKEPYIVTVSKESQKNNKGLMYETVGPSVKGVLLDKWLKKINVPIGITDKDGNIIEYGVTNRHSERKIANLLYFEMFRKSLPEYPWPFKPLQIREGFGEC